MTTSETFSSADGAELTADPSGGRSPGFSQEADNPPGTPSDPTDSTPVEPGPDPALSPEDAEARARSARLGAWVEAGATSVPALLIALGSALIGGLTLLVRRRRKH